MANYSEQYAEGICHYDKFSHISIPILYLFCKTAMVRQNHGWPYLSDTMYPRHWSCGFQTGPLVVSDAANNG